jgi:lipid-A-disaccharide synthase-like uncharacterized protein
MSMFLVILTGVLGMSEKVRRKVSVQGVVKATILFGMALGAVIGVAEVIMRRRGVELSQEAGVAIFLTVVALAVVAGTISAVVYWRIIDEAAREAHKFAWWWGGSLGGVVCLLAVLFAESPALEGVLGQQKAAVWLALGMLAMLLMQVAGYLLAWAGWWLARR